MNSTSKLWLPAGPGLTLGQRWALAVPATGEQPMTEEQHRLRLESKLRQLIEADEEQARAALEMSQDEAPELWTLAQEWTAKDWPTLLLNSDSLQSLLNRVDYSLPGSLREPREQSLLEILEQMA